MLLRSVPVFVGVCSRGERELESQVVGCLQNLHSHQSTDGRSRGCCEDGYEAGNEQVQGNDHRHEISNVVSTKVAIEGDAAKVESTGAGSAYLSPAPDCIGGIWDDCSKGRKEERGHGYGKDKG